MKMNGIQGNVFPLGGHQVISNKKKVDFSDVLKEQMEKVNQTMQVSKNTTNQFVKGNVENIHDVMIAAQKSSVALQLTVTVRDKVVESYQEIMRMQI